MKSISKHATLAFTFVFKQALKIQIAVFGANHLDVATSYNNIGVTYYSQREFDKVCEYYEKA